MRAPEAASRLRMSSGQRVRLMITMARPKPRKSLHSASMIWEIAVGIMFMCPWA